LSAGYRARPNDYANRWIKSQVLLSEADYQGAAHVLGDLNSERYHRLPYLGRFWNDVGLIYELANHDQTEAMYSEWGGKPLTLMPHKIGTLDQVVLGFPNDRYHYITAYDQFYLAGSPFAYLADQMNLMADDPLEYRRETARIRALDMVRVLMARGVRADLCHAFRGRILMLGGDTIAAGPDLRAAHQAFAAAGETDVGTTLLLGLVEMLDGNSTQAEVLFREALAEDPQQSAAWKNLAIACSKNGNSELASQAMDRALELDPDSAASWYNRGLMKFYQGNHEGALADLEKAWSLDPQDPRISTLLQRVANSRRGNEPLKRK